MIEAVSTVFKHHVSFFRTGQTRSLKFRKAQLTVLRKMILENEEQIYRALKIDLNKSQEETFLTEIALLLKEIELHLDHLTEWMMEKSVSTPLALFPSRSKLQVEPMGTACIIAPWNYPFQLMINPLIGAISAGCTAVLKPSPATPKTAELIEKLITSYFDPCYITVVRGDVDANEALFSCPFDVFFFTGSSRVGKIVMQAASKHLSKVILELGGKSPTIIDKDTSIKIAARRIAWGKLINSGQTCIAPDFIWIHRSQKEEFIQAFESSVEAMYGKDPMNHPDYVNIINESAVDRLSTYLMSGNVRMGGQVDKANRKIAPTILEDVNWDDPVMQSEIFGPILPLIVFDDLEEVVQKLQMLGKPLAMYYFGPEREAVRLRNETSSGAFCHNDVLLHVANHDLPFGGVGNSGMGKYHGHASFLAFSHEKAVLQSSSWIDFKIKYPPYRYFRLLKRLL
jgi:aldehyde dehydrogenase (NAD+)